MDYWIGAAIFVVACTLATALIAALFFWLNHVAYTSSIEDKIFDRDPYPTWTYSYIPVEDERKCEDEDEPHG